MGGEDSTVFAGYRVFGPVAAGGMASVHLARRADDDDGPYLALKRLHPHLVAREDVRRMFLNEAHILSRLEHPNVCGITDFGIEQDTPFLVMRYLHGAPLSGVLRRLLDLERPLPVDLMTYVVASVCDGLHYAHEAEGEHGRPLELVHRDISPQNIFVTFTGEVKLLDFGVAKAAGFESFTRTGHIKGKYAYMSPEQAAGAPLDRRSDVFSLGIVLWESLTGRHLFKRSRELDTLQAISAGVVPAPSKLNPAVSPTLDRILKRTLQTRAARRYQTAEALGAQLWSYLLSRPHPMGADEVAEILADVLSDQPDPAEQAHRLITEPEGVPLPSTTTRLPLEDLDAAIIEEATLAAQRALDADTDEEDEVVGDELDAPTGEATPPDVEDGPTGPNPVDPTPRDGAVAPVPVDAADLARPTELQAAPAPAKSRDLLTNTSPDDDVPELIPWRAEEANQARTVADPVMPEDLQRAVAARATDDEAPEDPSEHPTAGFDLSFLDRPRVEPHPFDHGAAFEPEAQETVHDDPPRTRAAHVVRTVPKQEISDVPPDLPADGPRIEGPPSLLDDPRAPAAPEPAGPTRAPSPPPRPARASTLVLALAALAVVAAALAVSFAWPDGIDAEARPSTRAAE